MAPASAALAFTLPSYQTGLTFVLRASVSLFISLLALGSHRPQAPTSTSQQFKPAPKSEGVVPLKDGMLCANDDGDLRKILAALNESVMTEFQRELQNTVPWADLSLLFTRWGRVYPSSRRRLVQTRSRKSRDCKFHLSNPFILVSHRLER